jgi:hypothetical protein
VASNVHIYQCIVVIIRVLLSAVWYCDVFCLVNISLDLSGIATGKRVPDATPNLSQWPFPSRCVLYLSQEFEKQPILTTDEKLTTIGYQERNEQS